MMGTAKSIMTSFEDIDDPAFLRDIIRGQMRQITHLREDRRHLSAYAGATAATLHAIAQAGGHVIADPRHQESIQTALNSLQRAHQDALNHRGFSLMRMDKVGRNEGEALNAEAKGRGV